VRRAPLTILPAVVLALLPATPAAHAATARQPILFVHGWSGSASNWDVMASRFRAVGYTSAELIQWDYNSAQDNVITANEVGAKVADIRRATGWSTIDVVTHSMGGLSTRYYLKNLGGQSYVDEWVSIGGPNHGTNSAYFCFTRSCHDMRFGSAFLTNINSGDETPGAVRYGTWWSPCDEVINPDTSTILSGATNTQTACIGHLGLLGSSTVFSQVRAFVA
jgi:triacylglycerol lipase